LWAVPTYPLRMATRHLEIGIPGGEQPIAHVFLEGRVYPDTILARNAWERVAEPPTIPDTGATRVSLTGDPADARAVVFMGWGHDAWRLLGNTRMDDDDGGEPWEVPDDVAQRLVNSRLDSVLAGEAGFIRRGNA
jgi:hypothetical protein